MSAERRTRLGRVERVTIRGEGGLSYRSYRSLPVDVVLERIALPVRVAAGLTPMDPRLFRSEPMERGARSCARPPARRRRC